MVNPVQQGPVPAVPEKLIHPSEVQKQETVESIASAELQPASSQTTSSNQQQDEQTSQNSQDTSNKTKPSAVVDKSRGKPKLHKLETPDSLTTIADEEEEEFIEKVDSAHEQHI